MGRWLISEPHKRNALTVTLPPSLAAAGGGFVVFVCIYFLKEGLTAWVKNR
jgi:hypothetical protein